ncbi:Uncharacterised protein [Amycolatopsis camponoti]|uniref:Integral membrane protein n=1 Tax=Amycolatopsis camponoti TaxID=2606593 RepID=A0A6I8LJ13_9PSEU|nr:hypothetical protein [Amycolatopsis camponoti]VVJ17041.1 Uncharacterised protein [Amycolatopsis camponoti]
MATTTRTKTVPKPVQAARALLALLGLSHLVIPVVLGLREDALRDQVAAQHPDFGAAEVARSADVAVVSGAIFHGLLLLLCLLLVVKLASGRPWTRWLTTVSQLLSVVFGFFSWSSSPMFHAVIPVAAAAQLAVVVLVWAPRSSRDFFAKR